MLVGMIAIIVILFCVLLWVNLLMIRPRPKVSASTTTGSEQPKTGGQGTSSSFSVDDSTSNSEAEPHRSEAGEALPVDTELLLYSADVEVMAGPTPKSQKLFDKPPHPFRVFETKVPAFGDERWKECFYQLVEDPRVLGWMAFQGDTLGASDREYEANFVDVLRTYRLTVEKLRKEVGISEVHETSVVGEEGKVWFITAMEGTWLALFLDAQTEAKLVTDRLLASVRSEE